MTAGNSSAINDGAAALVIMSEEKAKELGLSLIHIFAEALKAVDQEKEEDAQADRAKACEHSVEIGFDMEFL